MSKIDKKQRKSKWFTLVELIIVITILSILSIISFISFQSYTKDARDWDRVTTLKTIEKGISLTEIKTWHYPKPEDPVLISSWGSIYVVQWIVWDNISQQIKLNQTSKDPKTKDYYVYSTNLDQTRYQLWIYLENPEYISYIKKSYAENIIKPFYTIWSKLWIFFTNNWELINKSNSSSWELDLSNNDNKNKDFIVYFSNDKENWKYTWSWNILVEEIIKIQESDWIKPWENNSSNNWWWNNSNVILEYGAYKYNNWDYAKNCKEYKENETTTLSSWNYWIKINWVNSNNPFKVYCDMEKEGWWWTLVMRWIWWQQGNTLYTSATNWFQTENAVISSWTFIFSDNTLNTIRTNSWVYRVDVDYDIKSIIYSRYFSNTCEYKHQTYLQTSWSSCAINYSNLEDLYSNINWTNWTVCNWYYFKWLWWVNCSWSSNYLYNNYFAYPNYLWWYYKFNDKTHSEQLNTYCTWDMLWCNMYIYVK